MTEELQRRLTCKLITSDTKEEKIKIAQELGMTKEQAIELVNEMMSA